MKSGLIHHKAAIDGQDLPRHIAAAAREQKQHGGGHVVGHLGTLNGAAMGKAVIDFNKDDTSMTNTGQAIAVIDPAAFGDVGAFKARVDTLVRELRASDRMPGVDRIWLPGEQSDAKRQDYTAHGIPIAPALTQQLNQVADNLRVPRLSDTPI